MADRSEERDLRFKILKEVPKAEFLQVTVLPSFPNTFLALVHVFLRRAEASSE